MAKREKMLCHERITKKLHVREGLALRDQLVTIADLKVKRQVPFEVRFAGCGLV